MAQILVVEASGGDYDDRWSQSVRAGTDRAVLLAWIELKEATQRTHSKLRTQIDADLAAYRLANPEPKIRTDGMEPIPKWTKEQQKAGISTEMKIARREEKKAIDQRNFERSQKLNEPWQKYWSTFHAEHERLIQHYGLNRDEYDEAGREQSWDIIEVEWLGPSLS